MLAGAAAAAGLGVAGAPSAEAQPPVRNVVAASPLHASSPASPTAAAPVDSSSAGVASVTSVASEANRSADLTNLNKAVEQGRSAAEARQVTSAAQPAAARKGKVVSPTVGRVTSGFGPRGGTQHNGVDIANKIGTPIYAVTDGQVVESGPASGFGLWVRVKHPDGFTSVYGHINRSLVRAGQQVTAGQQIAEIGNRGQSTGPHLHLEIWNPGGKKLNAAQWLSERGVQLGRQP